VIFIQIVNTWKGPKQRIAKAFAVEKALLSPGTLALASGVQEGPVICPKGLPEALWNSSNPKYNLTFYFGQAIANHMSHGLRHKIP